MYHRLISEIGLSREEITQALSGQLVTAESIADVIIRNNQQIAERVNGVIDDLSDTIERALKTRP